jgi:hypothetical protein
LNDLRVRTDVNGRYLISEAPKPVHVIQKSSSGTDDKSAAEFFNKQVVPSDVRKANELVPSMILVKFHYKADTEAAVPLHLILGVKAKVYPVNSGDLIDRIVAKYDDKNAMLRFVKATTREISFFRDFLFAIDKAKLDALSQSRRGSSHKMWKVLERRAVKSKLRRTIGDTNDAKAITLLAISQEEVGYLRKNSGIDLGVTRVAHKIMDAYNFMGICIADETEEAAKFIYDTGSDEYEVLSFNLLEREASDSSYKKVVNLMSKITR